MLHASAWREAVAGRALVSFQSKQLPCRDLRVAEARARFLAAAHFSVREQLGPRHHSELYAETADSTRECQRSPLGNARSCPEEALNDPYLEIAYLAYPRSTIAIDVLTLQICNTTKVNRHDATKQTTGDTPFAR